MLREGMPMTFEPRLSLSFDGQCEAAFRHYAQLLDGEIVMMLKWSESPMAAEAPTGWEGKIIHASLRIGNVEITGTDVPPQSYAPPQGFEILLNVDDRATAERIFLQLSEGGTVRMPLQQTFWAGLYGVLVDRFAVPWSVNCGAEAGD